MSDRNKFFLNTYFNNILLFKECHYTVVSIKKQKKDKFGRGVLMELHVCNTPIWTRIYKERPVIDYI